MHEEILKRLSQARIAQRIAFLVALCIAIVLATAAIGKFFYPTEFFKIFDQIISGVEVVFICIIFFFRKNWKTWVGASLLFSVWSGYALFWYCLKLPCGCMGSMLNIPTLLSITLDGLFFTSSLFMSYLLGANKQTLYLSFLVGLFLSLGGFALGEAVYRYFVLV